MTQSKKLVAYTLCTSVAVAAIHTSPLTPKAQAQALDPVVDVCTGISLDDSVLTDILTDTVVPTAGAVELLYDDLLNLGVVGGILSSITGSPDLGVADTTTAIAGGDVVGLTVLDSDGAVVAPGDCNLTADGYALNDEAGLAIGGNQITGLGDGLAANAGELNAIALGNNASTDVGATGAIALGENASVTTANSIAIGADSVADRGALTGYTAFGLTGTQDSVGSVSFGSPGNLRQLTNIAPGSEATDAATVGQVEGAVTALADVAVQYDDDTQDQVTLSGGSGTTISNLADGDVSAGSSEAINGSQLFATNQQVGTNTSDIGDNTTAIGGLDTRVSTNANDIAALEDSAVQYDDGTQTSVTFGGAGGTTLSNVAEGALNTTSTEAVNGSQLHDTNLQVAQNASAIAAIDPTAGNAVSYTDSTLSDVVLGGADGTTVSNLADGELSASSTEAVNGSQLFATNQNIAANADEIVDLGARVTTNEGDIADIQFAVLDIDDRVTVNSATITDVQQQLANVPLGYVEDADPTVPSDTPTNTAALIGAGGDPVRVTNVAAGNLAAGSTDAVNGSQLAATNTAVAQNRTDIDQNTADITTINNNLAGSTVVAVQYSDPDDPTASNGGTITQDVTFVGADSSLPVRVHNVADAVLANDAVNLGQLQTGLADVMADSMAYTDSRFAVLSDGLSALAFDLDEVRDEAFAGTAGAMAVAGIPQTMEPGRSMFGGAIGHYRGETAFALGISTSFSDGQGVLKAGGTLDTHGNGGFTAGAGFSF